jgi:SAM-dependent methyltransferase
MRSPTSSVRVRAANTARTDVRSWPRVISSSQYGPEHTIRFMFLRSQRLYDAIYTWKDYQGEVAKLHALIQERNPGARALLDVACGTGKHLELLREQYKVEGVDVDPDMVRIAKERLPGVPIHEGDMVDLDLGKQFDAVTCLFSSIGYVGSAEKLDRAVASMSRHIAPGGVLLVEPWVTPDNFEPGRPSATFVDEPDLKIARMDVPKAEGRLSVLEFHYLIGTPDGIENFTEHHEVGLFTHEEYLKSFRKAGLDVEHDAEGLMGRGLYIGTRRE